jgi:predicted nucleic acid-binding Zn ribbon protein
VSDDRDEKYEIRVTQSSTVDGGKTPLTVDSTPSSEPAHDPGGAEESGDLVRNALADAQRISRGRRERPRQRRRPPGPAVDRGADGYSGPGPEATDPQPVGRLIAGYVEDRGWQRPLAEARVFADWGALVGSDVALHCTPSTLNAGELRVAAESTAWATQLRLLSATLLARLAAELGPDVVTKLHITGPVGPSWKHGGYSVRGTRGPRDTYG